MGDNWNQLGMPGARVLTVDDVLELVSYSADTGIFVWAKNRRGAARAGDVAGSRAEDGGWKISLYDSSYAAHRLAWICVHGVWPTGKVEHINGNRTDNRIANLRVMVNCDPGDTLTHKKLLEALRYDPETGVFTWKIGRRRRRSGDVAGSRNAQTYQLIQLYGRQYPAHRLAWLYVYGVWPSIYLDHKNGIRSDNRMCNLREANASENGYNRRRRCDASSGYKGVSWCPQTKSWKASIQVNKKFHHLGRFSSKEDAASAYREAALRLHGEFARPD